MTTVPNNIPAYVLVNGEVQELPTYVSVGTVLCFPKFINVSTGERWVLDHIIMGNLVSEDACIVANNSVTAYYKREYLITVVTSPPLFSKTIWASEGETVELSVPTEWVSNDLRYVFTSWGGILDGVTNNTVSVVVNSHLKLVANYERTFKVSIEGEDLGWYRIGDILVYPIPFSFNTSNGSVIEKVVDVVSVGSPAKFVNGKIIIQVQGNTFVSLVKKRYYRIIVHYFNTTRTEYVEEGQQYTVRTDQVIDAGAGTRYLFTGWYGTQSSPMTAFTFTVDGPTEIWAKYKKQYLVKLYTPLGEKETWVDENGPFLTYVRPAYGYVFRASVLTKILINGKEEPVSVPGVIYVPSVREPLNIVTVYEDVIEWTNVGLFVAIVWLTTVAYIVSTRFKSK